MEKIVITETAFGKLKTPVTLEGADDFYGGGYIVSDAFISFDSNKDQLFSLFYLFKGLPQSPEPPGQAFFISETAVNKKLIPALKSQNQNPKVWRMYLLNNRVGVNATVGTQQLPSSFILQNKIVDIRRSIKDNEIDSDGISVFDINNLRVSTGPQTYDQEFINAVEFNPNELEITGITWAALYQIAQEYVGSISITDGEGVAILERKTLSKSKGVWMKALAGVAIYKTLKTFIK